MNALFLINSHCNLVNIHPFSVSGKLNLEHSVQRVRVVIRPLHGAGELSNMTVGGCGCDLSQMISFQNWNNTPDMTPLNASFQILSTPGWMKIPSHSMHNNNGTRVVPMLCIHWRNMGQCFASSFIYRRVSTKLLWLDKVVLLLQFIIKFAHQLKLIKIKTNWLFN